MEGVAMRRLNSATASAVYCWEMVVSMSIFLLSRFVVMSYDLQISTFFLRYPKKIVANIGCASTKKTKKLCLLFCFVFGFHYICRIKL